MASAVIAPPGPDDDPTRRVLDHVPIMVWRSAIDARCEYVNATWLEFTGRALAEELGDGWADSVHPDDRAQQLDVYRSHAARGEPFELEYRLRRRDGAWRWVLGRGAPYFDTAGGLAGFVGSCIDIHEQYESRVRSARQVDRMRRLVDVTALLARTVRPHEIAEIVVEQGARAVGASRASMMLLDRQGETLELVHAHGYADQPQALASSRRIPMTVDMPGTDVVRFGVPVWLQSRSEYAARYPEADRITQTIDTATDFALACVPVRLSGRTHGMLGFIFDESHKLDEEERGFLTLLGRHCAQALERAELYHAQQAARRDAEAARERAVFLVDAGAVLSSSLDPEQTLRNLADLVVHRWADWCSVELKSDDGSGRATVAHVDPRKVEYAAELNRRYPPDPKAPTGSPQVLRTGISELYAEIPEELLLAGAKDDEHRRIILELGLRSAMVVPIKARGTVLGVITFVSAESGRRYDREDLASAELLGERAGLAIDNARLFEAERRAVAHSGKLHRISSAFARATTVDEVTAIAVELGRTLLQADGAAAGLVTEDGLALDIRDASGLPDTELADVRRLPLTFPSLATDAVRHDRVVIVDSLAEYRSSYPEMGSRLSFDGGGRLAIPLRAEGRAIGALVLGFPTWHRIGAEDRLICEALTDQCGQALDRAVVYQQALRAVALRDDFLLVAGHELKTPLSALVLQVQLLKQRAAGAVPAPIDAGLDKLDRIGARITTLVDELLDVSRITTGRLTLDRSRFDLADIVREVLASLTDDVSKPSSRVDARLTVPAVGNWDRTRIEQVVVNLVSNAMKYGRGRTVEVEVAMADARAVLIVRDHGIGIPAEDHGRIFQRFERAVSSRHFGGLGLGLWISRQIVEAHGGSIAVRSEPGLGAEFRVELPS